MGIKDRAVVKFNQWKFLREVKNILGTPRIERGNWPMIVLSMVHQRDVLPYLLAIKSFCRQLSPSRIVVVADPTIGDSERALIQEHVPFVEFRRAEEFRKTGIPQGGCWERLCAISEYVATDYVIQLDADTVAISALPEVSRAIERGIAFTLATDDAFTKRLTCCEISDWAEPRLTGTDHVQLEGEALLGRLPGASELSYFRGCAGFAGYPCASFDFNRLAHFSMQMEGIMGSRWREWGTEQLTSNFLVANVKNSILLPHNKYCAPHRVTRETAFLHFIGYVRFTSGLYASTAHEQVQALRRSPSKVSE